VSNIIDEGNCNTKIEQDQGCFDGQPTKKESTQDKSEDPN
jgi:hypothetical protein